MRLLERDTPLAELRRLHEEAGRDGGRLVFVEGEAGIGKTSLLAAFRAVLPAGTTSLIGSCDPLSTPRPLGPFLDVADGLDTSLARLLDGGGTRAQTLRGLLDAVGRRPGLVLCLDDLHWADEATLDALRFLGRRIATTRVLLVGTFRDDEVGPEHPLRAVVGDLATSPAVRRLPLTRLSQASVRELASGSGIDPADLHRQTGGNPFFVTEVLAGAPATVPATVRDAVLARAARLSPVARRTLEAAAIIGPLVDPGLLIRVADPVAADECLAGGLLVVRDDRYAFRHEVARDAILGATDPSVQIRLHTRVLEALEARGAGLVPLAVLAHHADGAGDHAAVLRYAPAAALEAAAANAHREAAAHLDRAVRAAGALPQAERADLLQRYADAQSAIGRDDLAVTAYMEAAGIWRRHEMPLDESRAWCGVAGACIGLGRNTDAEGASRRALDLTAAAPTSPERVGALMTQAYLRMLDRDNEEAIALGREVIDRDPASIDPATRGSALNIIGSARILLDDPDGRDDLLRALGVFEAAGIAWGVRSCYGNLGSAFGEIHRYAEAEAYLEAGLRFADEHDVDASYLGAWQALVHLQRGRWTSAEDVARTVIGRPHVLPIARLMALLALGRLRARRGDGDVWPVLDEALDLAVPTGTLQRIGPVRAARAEAAWLEGDLERSGEEAAAAVDLAIRKGHRWHVGELGWWMARSGRSVSNAVVAAEPWRLQLAGRWREAADAWHGRDCPYEAARAVLDGDDPAAIEAAFHAFDALGAAPAAARAARRLRDLGVRAVPRGRRPSTRRNPAGLTERELEVLALVVAGLQNAAIADRLVLSPRTVDHHVSAVLRKLGVDRRQEAAGAAARLGVDLQDGWSTGPR